VYLKNYSAEESQKNRENVLNLNSQFTEFRTDMIDKIHNIENKQKKQIDGLKFVLENNNLRAPNKKIHKIFSDNPKEVEEAKNAFIKPTKGEIKLAIHDISNKNSIGRKATLPSNQIHEFLRMKINYNKDLKKVIENNDGEDGLNLESWKNNKILTIKEKMHLNLVQKNKTFFDKIKRKLSSFKNINYK